MAGRRRTTEVHTRISVGSENFGNQACRCGLLRANLELLLAAQAATMVRKRKKQQEEAKPFCFYCDREFQVSENDIGAFVLLALCFGDGDQAWEEGSCR